jgi:hypothetical protein
MLGQLALARAGLNDLPRAGELAWRAISVARERLTKPSECEAQLILARILLDAGTSELREEIQAALSAAAALADEMGARSFDPFVLEERARLARLLGDDPGRERHLREAHRLYAEMDATGHAERLARALAELGSGVGE